MEQQQKKKYTKKTICNKCKKNYNKRKVPAVKKSENKIKNKKKAPNFCKIYWMHKTLAKIQVKFIMQQKTGKIENKN